jgi:sugar lactone lactonase YvrE
MKTSRITAVSPPRAVEGGRVRIDGERFAVDGGELPRVRLGERDARLVFASNSRLEVVVPAGFTRSGRVPVNIVNIDPSAADGPSLEVGAPFATGLHQIDNPVFDRQGNLYVTFSGTRGEQVPVSIFRVRPDGTRETFSSNIVNPTSMAVDPQGRLFVSSRFEGTVYKLEDDGSAEPFVTDLGIACGLAFAPDGTLFVGDRSGTIFEVSPDGRARTFVTLPSSVAAFHLALAPGGALYVTGPTLSSHDALYRIDPNGKVTIQTEVFGRPQGVAFDSSGTLHVVEALAGMSGVYRLPADGDPELVLAGSSLVGLAFREDTEMVVCSGETAYRFH